MLECKTTALACLTESHTVVFGTHPGGARHRVILPQFRVSYLLLLRRKGVYHTCFLKLDMYHLFLRIASNLFRVVRKLMKFEFMPELNVIPFYTAK